jgi:hypothetical protein
MLDNDLAVLYGVDVKRLNEQVKRNSERFPREFMFQLTANEVESLRSQIATSNQRGGRRYLPYVFTEQGVSMLSAVLRSETAVKVSIRIMNAFVSMRRFITANAQVFERMATLEVKQIETDKKIDKVLNAIESRDIHPKQGIFYDGQIFDAYKFVSDLFRSAKHSIVIIDNYIDDTVLTHLAKRHENVKVTILTRVVSKQMHLDISKYNNVLNGGFVIKPSVPTHYYPKLRIMNSISRLK